MDLHILSVFNGVGAKKVAQMVEGGLGGAKKVAQIVEGGLGDGKRVQNLVSFENWGWGMDQHC